MTPTVPQAAPESKLLFTKVELINEAKPPTIRVILRNSRVIRVKFMHEIFERECKRMDANEI